MNVNRVESKLCTLNAHCLRTLRPRILKQSCPATPPFSLIPFPASGNTPTNGNLVVPTVCGANLRYVSSTYSIALGLVYLDIPRLTLGPRSFCFSPPMPSRRGASALELTDSGFIQQTLSVVDCWRKISHVRIDLLKLQRCSILFP